ncbi:MAG: peptidyl-prolyl cis-trans isomerase [Myxococcales bacterium]
MLARESRARMPAIVLLLGASTALAAATKPVAQVGSEAISAEALTRRLAKIPDFQRAALGSTPELLKHHVLESELVPDLLYAQEAARLKLDATPSAQQRTRELLREALERQLRQETVARSPVTADEIKAYFEANRARFETPRRVHIWRILTDDEALAKRIIAESKGVDGIQHWSQFARESSLDKATHLRNGDLGFVHPDGNTDTPTLRVDPALFAVADKLSDGELSPEPMKEGLHFAVLWRRGSTKALTRTVSQEEGSIRQVLERKRLEKAREELLAGLRTKFVSVNNEALLETFQFSAQGLPARSAAPRPTHAAAAASQAPVLGERGER